MRGPRRPLLRTVGVSLILAVAGASSEVQRQSSVFGLVAEIATFEDFHRDGGIIGHPTAWITVDLERERVAGIRVTYSSAM